MYTSTFYTAALLSLLSMARAGGEPGAAGMCNNLVTSLAACSSQSAAFYATVTDEAQAMATAAACICYSSGTFNAAAVDAGLSACVAELGTATTVVPELGVTVDGDNLTPYYGFCNAYAPTVSPSIPNGRRHQADINLYRPRRPVVLLIPDRHRWQPRLLQCQLTPVLRALSTASLLCQYVLSLSPV